MSTAEPDPGVRETDDRPTLFALSSGRPPAGLAVIRISGPSTRFGLEMMAGGLPPARRASLRPIRHPATGETIDTGLVLWFPAPGSFTGEPSAELQVHGGRAVVAAVLSALAALPGFRLAGPGEFTRRAFENGVLDLTAVEGLADLIAAETDQQRRQALHLAGGALSRHVEVWRSALLGARALVEAELDFSDEDDVGEGVADRVGQDLARILADVRATLADFGRGAMIRDGYHVAIMGPPNAGKSSLLNALARRDAAIVTDVPGTTRDIVEVTLDLDGAPVVLADTAGIRPTADVVESEGIRRAVQRGRSAHLVIWLAENSDWPAAETVGGAPMVVIRSKADLRRIEPSAAAGGFPTAISTVTGAGLAELEAALAVRANEGRTGEPALVTRVRHVEILRTLEADLIEALLDGPAEVRADALRRATDGLGRLVGRIGVEEVLGEIFSSFCIGK